VTVDPAAAARALALEAGLDPDRLLLATVPLDLVGVGWATVDADRAAGELGLPGHPVAVVAVDPDVLLGAAGSIWRPAPDEPSLMLLEPSTEGLLAACLARRAEGPAVLYLAPLEGLAAGLERLGAAGVRARRGDGPFGPEALVLDRTPAEPQLMLVGVPSRT